MCVCVCVCLCVYDNWQGGVHLPPQEFHKAMEQDNTVGCARSVVVGRGGGFTCKQVIIDVRNIYETTIGHFNPQVRRAEAAEAAAAPAAAAAAQLIDPKMRQSTDFPGWLQVRLVLQFVQ
jgi:predicted sulfurtransferase